MSAPIKSHLEFYQLICKAMGVRAINLELRQACVITRSPANYGLGSSVMIELEGSPPRYGIYCGDGLMVFGKQIKGARAVEVCKLIDRFLAVHPANKDDTPVWIGTRWKDKP